MTQLPPDPRWPSTRHLSPPVPPPAPAAPPPQIVYLQAPPPPAERGPFGLNTPNFIAALVLAPIVVVFVGKVIAWIVQIFIPRLA